MDTILNNKFLNPSIIIKLYFSHSTGFMKSRCKIHSTSDKSLRRWSTNSKRGISRNAIIAVICREIVIITTCIKTLSLLLGIFMTITKLHCTPHRLKILFSPKIIKKLLFTPWWIKFLCFSEPFYGFITSSFALKKIMQISFVWSYKKSLNIFHIHTESGKATIDTRERNSF